jgi:hypothetical protein
MLEPCLDGISAVFLFYLPFFSFIVQKNFLSAILDFYLPKIQYICHSSKCDNFREPISVNQTCSYPTTLQNSKKPPPFTLTNFHLTIFRVK